MEPAGTVVRALGGVRNTAKQLHVSAEAVSSWNRPVDRGGTGGYIPHKFWSKILEIAQSLGSEEITRDMLAKAKREKIDVVSSSKAKGDRFERAVVEELREVGFDAHRVPLSGAAAGFVGDVEIRNWKGRRYVIQCKNTKDHGAGGRTSIARMLAQVSFGRVKASGHDLLAMRRSVFIAYLNGYDLLAANMPLIIIPGKQILAHLKDHDALLFRRTTGPHATREWMAVISLEKKSEASSAPAA